MEEYVGSCPECSQLKSSNQFPSSQLQLLPMPSRLDCITDLTSTLGNTVILTIMDRFLKICHLVSLPKLPMTNELTNLLVMSVFHYYDIPEDIVSDRGHIQSGVLVLLL